VSHVPRTRANLCLIVLVVWSIVLGALSWSRPAAAADADPVPQYHCLRNNLLISSYLPCDYGTQTPDLINRFRLVPGLGPDGGLYDATPEQQGALERFQLQAYQDVLLAHGLPESDLPVVKSWARSQATAHLWALVTEAINTDPGERTNDQTLVVEWSSALLQRQAIATPEQSALEYASWAGIDPAPLEAAMAAPGWTERRHHHRSAVRLPPQLQPVRRLLQLRTADAVHQLRR
jgi:hypothetical protein